MAATAIPDDRDALCPSPAGRYTGGRRGPDVKTIMFAIAALLAGTADAATYVQAGQLLDRPGHAPRGPSTIIVRDGKVAEVRDGFVAPGADDTLVDLKDRFVLPGLIDMHVHFYASGNPLMQRLAAATSDREDDLLLAQANARRTLEAGFTTVRDLGGDPRGMRALRDAVTRGDVSGPTIINAGEMISVSGGHGDANGLNRDLTEIAHRHGEAICNGPDDCRRAVRQQVSMGAEVIKFAATGGVLSNVAGGLGKQMTDEEMRAIVETAHGFDRKVAAHAHAKEGVDAALNAGVDSIEHGSFGDDATFRLYKAKGTYLVPTMLAPLAAVAGARSGALPPATLPKAEAAIVAMQAMDRKAIAAGVKIAFGTDSGVSLHGDNAKEFALMVKAGMTPMAAIVAATVNAADLAGRSDQIGTLEPGKYADLIAVAGSPLDDVTRLERVDFVMRHGVVAKAGGKRQPLP